MAAKVVYFDEKEVKTLDAVLVGVIHVSTNPGGMTASGTKTASFVSLFVREEVKAD
jgi:hypothetical protein